MRTEAPTLDRPAVGQHPGVAFFDFDGTLVHGDTLPMFIAEVIGRRRTQLAFADAIRSAGHRHLRGRGPGVDFRGSIKAILLKRTLRGLPLADAHAAAERLSAKLRWHPPTVQALREHRRAGRRVVVATGALDVYMPFLLRDEAVDDLLATGMEVQDGRLTGRLATGNCVRIDKADRVRAWLAANGPASETWGYGNRPSDLPMLALLDRKIVVRIP
ncbi:HAD family hydrolase [Azospirillum sp. TSO22-1]|uniref:HAD family hydrolase n=1 Tax=Azospirillum sp. TSO22-1 TaxID=716789 RepID=UPI000D61C5D9|nr:HAD family hydrolase [Azospirillum sp. TSO22-1]PWC52920.1 haloacid dehalogenase [Azospirillum sp. TSO22-1]